MGIWLGLAIWILSWVFIIFLSACALANYNTDVKKYGNDYIELASYDKSKQEMLKDGNNLFATGLLYFGANILVHFIHNDVLGWVLLILGVLFCIPSILSSFSMIKQAFLLKNKYITFMTLTALISTYIPLILAINIYFLTLV